MSEGVKEESRDGVGGRCAVPSFYGITIYLAADGKCWRCLDDDMNEVRAGESVRQGYMYLCEAHIAEAKAFVDGSARPPIPPFKRPATESTGDSADHDA